MVCPSWTKTFLRTQHHHRTWRVTSHERLTLRPQFVSPRGPDAIATTRPHTTGRRPATYCCKVRECSRALSVAPFHDHKFGQISHHEGGLRVEIPEQPEMDLQPAHPEVLGQTRFSLQPVERRNIVFACACASPMASFHFEILSRHASCCLSISASLSSRRNGLARRRPRAAALPRNTCIQVMSGRVAERRAEARRQGGSLDPTRC